MFSQTDYLSVAKQYEEVFRNVLRDLRLNGRPKLPAYSIPEVLGTEATLDDIFMKYSTGNRNGLFTICDFTRPAEDAAHIFIKNTAPLSGGGAELRYLVEKDNSVVFKRQGIVFLS